MHIRVGKEEGCGTVDAVSSSGTALMRPLGIHMKCKASSCHTYCTDAGRSTCTRQSLQSQNMVRHFHSRDRLSAQTRSSPQDTYHKTHINLTRVPRTNLHTQNSLNSTRQLIHSFKCRYSLLIDPKDNSIKRQLAKGAGEGEGNFARTQRVKLTTSCRE